MISPSQRPLNDNTQLSQQTDIHSPGGIGTRNPKKRATQTDALNHEAAVISFAFVGNLKKRDTLLT
jgi:hypothetical protein